MSFRFGIDNYFYYNEPIPRNNDIYKEKTPNEIENSNKYKIGEKNK